ncbi:MAG: RNA polymerase sigma factor [Gemmataceae bacterium]|nr:RNA polymerase sigma factor [Gemmataceae bacterium]MCI0738840.1 RNA polymerase sigma factor [Gemmataceae bacterium]
MQLRKLSTLAGELRRLFRPANGEEGSDAELLQRYVRHGDGTAIEMLVARHAGLVLGVSRRVLGDGNDADDAFQATFLTLIRKAKNIREGQALVGWLHTVALRAAWEIHKARPEPADARSEPRIIAPRAKDDPADVAERHEYARILDEEITRLPDRFRLPILLCYMEGKSNEEAGRQLGCPPGTIMSRLNRARGRLRKALVRRGVTLSAATLAVVLSRDAFCNACSPALLAGVGRLARLFAAGGLAALADAVPAATLALSGNLARGLAAGKLKLVVFAGLACCLFALGAALWSSLSRPQAPPLAFNPPPAQHEPPALALSPEQRIFQGAWLSLQEGDASKDFYGTMMDPVSNNQLSISFHDDRVRFDSPKVSYAGTYKVGKDAKPAEIEMHLFPVETGKATEQRLRGIYQMKDDLLRLCLVPVGEDLPFLFQVSCRTPTLLYVLERREYSSPDE